MNRQVYCEFQMESRLEEFVDRLAEYFSPQAYSIYVLDKPLNVSDESGYSYTGGVVILIPKHKILFVDIDGDQSAFKNYIDDFIEDLGHLSDKYQYKKLLGRPRMWQSLITSVSLSELISNTSERYDEKYSIKKEDIRRIELLISLLIGSINEVEGLNVDLPKTLLDSVKQKIILFDSIQSHFIYERVDKKVVRIQGLAGTGKTELLLHRLKRLYMAERDCKIAFTCFNHVLAEDMRSRVPRFFNYMKVDEQIEWQSRLFVFPSWGSRSVATSGMYSYICNIYNLRFYNYTQAGSFDSACKQAIEELRAKDSFLPCFTYVFIDESQDFSDAFVQLCELVTEKQVYVAGDIFQNIFDMNITSSVDCDYVLNKCYRTDPRTLMFAHAVGMGLYEEPIIRWLRESEWENCGYSHSKIDEASMVLGRIPVRRFDDCALSAKKSVECISFSADNTINSICTCIDSIRGENPSLSPEDIGIIFTHTGRSMYTTVDELALTIKMKYNWDVCKGFIKKEREKGKLLISNTNNIKGLEFPYVVCVSIGKITRNILLRNSIYMALTRSFIKSYFMVEENNVEFFATYVSAADRINENSNMTVRIPSAEEVELQERVIRITSVPRKSVEQIINEVCSEYPELAEKHISAINNAIPSMLSEETQEEIIEKTRAMIQIIIGKKG